MAYCGKTGATRGGIPADDNYHSLRPCLANGRPTSCTRQSQELCLNSDSSLAHFVTPIRSDSDLDTLQERSFFAPRMATDLSPFATDSPSANAAETAANPNDIPTCSASRRFGINTEVSAGIIRFITKSQRIISDQTRSDIGASLTGGHCCQPRHQCAPYAKEEAANSADYYRATKAKIVWKRMERRVVPTCYACRKATMYPDASAALAFCNQ